MLEPHGRGRIDCLAGYVVLDLTAFLAGPYCTDILSALGATVIKVEPPTGDYYRRVRPPWVGTAGASMDQLEAGDDVMALAFLKRNADKLSVVLDLTTEPGQRAFERLVVAADALVQNYKPGTAKRLQLTSERLQKLNPKLVYVTLDGLGSYAEDGDERPVIDYGVQALSGVMRMGIPADAPPRWSGLPIADVSGGLYAAIAVLAGLLARPSDQESEKAHAFSVSMLGALSAVAWSFRAPDATAMWNLPEANATSTPSTGTRIVQTADGKWLFLSGVGDDQWKRLMAATGIDEFNDERFSTRHGRDENVAEVNALLERWALTVSRDEAFRRLTAEHVSVWPIRGPEELITDTRFRDEFLYELEHPVHGLCGLHGTVSPIRANREDAWIEDGLAPLLGEHTSVVLEQYAGYTKAEIDELLGAGAATQHARLGEHA
jgi:formyl-CoA transferase